MRSLVRALCAALMLAAGMGLQIELNPGELRCIAQVLDQLEPVVFAVSATSKVNDARQRVTMTVTDPEDEDIISERVAIGAKRKEIEKRVEARGAHEMCFELQDARAPVRIFFHVEYKPLTAEGVDLSRKVKKDDLPSIESQLQLAHRRVEEISNEIEHSRKQELALREAGDSASSRIQWFGVLSIAILLGMSLWQIVYLRRFFASKKLL